jgi:hypothetical protein
VPFYLGQYAGWIAGVGAALVGIGLALRRLRRRNPEE